MSDVNHIAALIWGIQQRPSASTQCSQRWRMEGFATWYIPRKLTWSIQGSATIWSINIRGAYRGVTAASTMPCISYVSSGSFVSRHVDFRSAWKTKLEYLTDRLSDLGTGTPPLIEGDVWVWVNNSLSRFNQSVQIYISFHKDFSTHIRRYLFRPVHWENCTPSRIYRI